VPIRPLQPLPTTYDSLFEKHGRQIPVAYLRALSSRESNMNPNEAQLPAYGLLQVIAEVARDAGFSHQDMFDPDKNVQAATRTLNRIVESYDRHHNMSADWSDPEYVKLVTAGWNSGYSEVAGVGKVLRWLKDNGIEVTHDNVLANAQQAGAVHYLYANPQRTLSWQRSVMDLYFRQPDAPDPYSGGAVGFLLKVGAAVAAGLLLARYLK
jgi:hypothetical protein